MRVTYFTSSFQTRIILFYLMMFSAVAMGFAGHVVLGAILSLPILLAAMMGVSISFPSLNKQTRSQIKEQHLSLS